MFHFWVIWRKTLTIPHDRVNNRREVLHKDLKFPMSKGQKKDGLNDAGKFGFIG